MNNILCQYGCGQIAKYKTKGGRDICSPSPNSCPANRRKNSEAGKNLSPEKKKRRSDGVQKAWDERKEDILAKQRATNQKNSGVDYPQQSKKIRQKTLDTLQKEYGVINIMHHKPANDKRKATNMERFGVEEAVGSNHVDAKRRATMFERYGVENIFHLPEKRGNSAISKMANDWLDSLDIPEDWRELPIPETVYTADALDIKNKVIYEFYGDYWHGNPKKYDKEVINEQAEKSFGQLYAITIGREKYLKKLGYIFITIWEYDWTKKGRRKRRPHQ